MRMHSKVFKISILFSFLLSVSAARLSAQQNSFTDRLSNTGTNISGAVQSIVKWYDIPVGAAYFYRNYINQPFSVNPAPFEKEIAEDFGNTNFVSLGSMDKDIIPRTIFVTRFAVTTGLNLFTGANITQDSYRNIFLFEKSLIYTYTATEIVKNLFYRKRPDGSDNRSFFSGHTSTTFAAATFLYLEMNDFYNDWDVTKENPFLRNSFKAATFTVLYGWSGYVGYSRIHDKKHYLSDVLVGAAVGTLISVFVYDNYINKKIKFLDKFSFQTSGKTLGLNYNLTF